MSLIKWKPLNNEIDTFDNIIDQFFNDLSYDPRFSLMNTNNVSNYYNENESKNDNINYFNDINEIGILVGFQNENRNKEKKMS